MSRSEQEIAALVHDEARAAEDAESVHDDLAPLPEGSRVTRGRGRTRVLQVRLNEDEFAALEQLAEARGIPTSTVARGLILAGLAPESDAGALITRIEAELATLRRTVAVQG